MRDDIRAKYTGLQTRLRERAGMLARMGDEACLFLCLCSIAEEWFGDFNKSGRSLDIAEFAMRCRDKGYIDDTWTCHTEDILLLATGVSWRKAEVKEIPAVVPDEMYTVEKWFNPRTGYTHFRRRWGDTVKDSVTVREGKFECYYTFTCLEAR